LRSVNVDANAIGSGGMEMLQRPLLQNRKCDGLVLPEYGIGRRRWPRFVRDTGCSTRHCGLAIASGAAHGVAIQWDPRERSTWGSC
jgi:hypothetical protein